MGERAARGALNRGDVQMKFMLKQNYTPIEVREVMSAAPTEQLA